MKIISCEEIEKENYIIIDTRSPKEYADHHIPDAVSVPIFTDAERHEIAISTSRFLFLMRIILH